VEFVTAREPGRLTLDPRLLAYDWNALNNRERRAFSGRSSRTVNIDNPTKSPMRRDRILTALLPLAWYNDFGGVTAALPSRENYLGRFEKNLALLSFGFDPEATHPFGAYVRFGTPATRCHGPMRAWPAGLWKDAPASRSAPTARCENIKTRRRQARRLRCDLDGGEQPRLRDRELWDNAGTVEAGPWASDERRRRRRCGALAAACVVGSSIAIRSRRRVIGSL
jgi:hypothetical protein